MLIRVVKMEFEEALVPDFLENFAANKDRIRSFPGCTFLQLLQDESDPGTFFTYSHWQGPGELNVYRNSDLFKTVWAKTKKLFRSPPVAWSLTDLTQGVSE